MIAVIIGYEGSQCIVQASKYLARKYLPETISRIYLNYTGEINGWSQYLISFLNCIDDDYIVFALDDYLISNYFSENTFFSHLWDMQMEAAACVKLCDSTEEEHNEYPVTTQWAIWNKHYLIALLYQVKTPWEFEIHGSKIIDRKVLKGGGLEYFTNSSISSRWEGVRLDGLKQEDIDYIKENNLLQ